MTMTLSEPVRERAPSAGRAEWLIAFGRDERTVPSPAHAHRWRSAGSSLSITGVEGSDASVAQSAGWVVLVAGLVTNAGELEPQATQADAARIVLDLIGQHGAAAFDMLRGPFVVVAWDRRTDTVLAARDHVGLGSLFYARDGGGGWLFSASPETLVAEPNVSREVDAVSLSEWLCGWFPSQEDTSYRHVKRIPPGSVATFRTTGMEMRRYWNLFSNGQPYQWVKEAELEAFEPLLNRAIGRATRGVPSAIFLSGGVDSISVAVAAADLAAERGEATPLALSMVFPEGEAYEEPIQAGVARQLGLEQVCVPLAEAAGRPGLLAAALMQNAGWPQPMWNIWSPAYTSLARHAVQRGKGVILTGRGGDEWLTITPYLLADQIGRGDLLGAWRLIQMRRRSNGLKGVGNIGRLLWATAGRSLASAALDAMAPAMWHRRRRRRLLTERPDWVAPDPAIRRAMDERIDRWIEPARPAEGFYHREASLAVRHPAVAMDLEETQEFGRRLGLRVLHPYWDVDLLTLLQRIPPDLLMRDGRSKWLVRRRISRRLPGLGLEKRGKIYAGSVFSGIMNREAPAAWRALGGARTLAQLGVTRAADTDAQAQPLRLMQGRKGPGYLWTLLNFESWVQPRV